MQPNPLYPEYEYKSEDQITIGPVVNEKDVQFAINSLFNLEESLKSAPPEYHKYIFQIYNPKTTLKWLKESAAKWALYREKYGPNEIDPGTNVWINAAIIEIKNARHKYAKTMLFEDDENKIPDLGYVIDELWGKTSEVIVYAQKLANALANGQTVVEPFDYNKLSELYLHPPHGRWLKD